MLQSIPPSHDGHHDRSIRNSTASLTASLQDSRTHLLLACSGSVATIKLPLIIKALSAHPNLSIRVLLTPSASRFLAGQSAEQPTVSSLFDLPNVDGVYVDEDEWKEPWKRGNGILHIELRRWADMLVIAPLSANTMAKIVNGMADGILTSVVRAWDARGGLGTDVDRDAAGAATGASSGSVRATKRIIVAREYSKQVTP
jgi:phosphopantothenoylcysteine decarboxylase